MPSRRFPDPSLTVPVLAWQADVIEVVIEFNHDVTIVNNDPTPWTVANLEGASVLDVRQPGGEPSKILLVMSTRVQAESVTFGPPPFGLVDEFGRNVQGFSDFPVTMM